MNRRAALLAGAIAVVAGVAGLAISLRGEPPPPGPGTRPADSVAPAPSERSVRPRSPVAPSPARPALDPRSDPDAEGRDGADEPIRRTVTADGRMVADHRGRPKRDLPRPKIRGPNATALRKDLRPAVQSCAEAVTDPDGSAGEPFSVTAFVSARDGRFEIESATVATATGWSDEPFFACVEEALTGMQVPAPDGQESAESQRVTFPYRVP